MNRCIQSCLINRQVHIWCTVQRHTIAITRCYQTFAIFWRQGLQIYHTHRCTATPLSIFKVSNWLLHLPVDSVPYSSVWSMFLHVTHRLKDAVRLLHGIIRKTSLSSVSFPLCSLPAFHPVLGNGKHMLFRGSRNWMLNRAEPLVMRCHEKTWRQCIMADSALATQASRRLSRRTVEETFKC